MIFAPIYDFASLILRFEPRVDFSAVTSDVDACRISLARDYLIYFEAAQ